MVEGDEGDYDMARDEEEEYFNDWKEANLVRLTNEFIQDNKDDFYNYCKVAFKHER